MKNYEFSQCRFDTMRTYSPESVIATFPAANSRMPDVESRREYKPASEEYKSVMGFVGEVLITRVDAKSKNNFHAKSLEEIQLREPADMKKFVETVEADISNPDDLLNVRPNVITKWHFDPEQKIFYVQTARTKENMSTAQVDSEIKYNHAALSAIKEVIGESFPEPVKEAVPPAK